MLVLLEMGLDRVVEAGSLGVPHLADPAGGFLQVQPPQRKCVDQYMGVFGSTLTIPAIAVTIVIQEGYPWTP